MWHWHYILDVLKLQSLGPHFAGSPQPWAAISGTHHNNPLSPPPTHTSGWGAHCPLAWPHSLPMPGLQEWGGLEKASLPPAFCEHGDRPLSPHCPLANPQCSSAPTQLWSIYPFWPQMDMGMDQHHPAAPAPTSLAQLCSPRPSSAPPIPVSHPL